MTTQSKFKRIKEEYDRLVRDSNNLEISMNRVVYPDKIDKQLRGMYGDEFDEIVKMLPNFSTAYQAWYSEASAVVKQLLPDRLADFQSHYLRPKGVRKELSAANYVIEDFIQGLRATRGIDYVVVDQSAALPRFSAQIAILKACGTKFESSLYDLRHMVQADLMDSELGAAKELLKNGFIRAAGVVAGVVLEKHLQQIAEQRSIAIKQRPTLGDYVSALKEAEVISVSDWRKLQYLNEIRVKCSHNKREEPTSEEVADLIAGTDRTIKNLF